MPTLGQVLARTLANLGLGPPAVLFSPAYQPPEPTYRWEVLLRYFSLGGQNAWATAKGPKSPAAPLTKKEICSWLANDLSSVQVQVDAGGGNTFLTPSLDSWIAVVAWDNSMSYPIAQYGPGQAWQVLNQMGCG